ncbi:mitochondrial folate transporter/carrier-like [Manduca sexta]|uniref:mitochondrial folate transporter/carrier-like n=1 Tax=Manduca sexta TaxID=7130 RepID=UPI00188FBCFD|nr:mitochondrial folate transporter/carrier-like [Manduca sexta]
MFGVSHGALQFMAYEEMKNRYNQYRNLPIDIKLTSLEYLTFAAVSKLLAAGATYPYQVVRARLQHRGARATAARGTACATPGGTRAVADSTRV